MTNAINLEAGLAVAAVLFGLGLAGVLVRRHVLMTLMSIEVMVNASGLAFIVAGSRWNSLDGQVMFLLVLSVAAAEVSVGLALAVLQKRRFGAMDPDALNRMRG